MSGAGEPPDRALPGAWLVYASPIGITVSFLGSWTVWGLFALVNWFVPLRPPGNDDMPAWMWPVMALVWAPAVAGLLLPIYTVARYPYYGLLKAGEPREIQTGRGVFKLLGWFLWLIAVPFALAAVAFALTEPLTGLAMGYGVVELLFCGFLLARYRPDRHPTVATWLMTTCGFGVPFAPFYFPSLWLGSRRLRRALGGRGAGGDAGR